MNTNNNGNDFLKYVVGGILFEAIYFCLGYFGIILLPDIAMFIMGIVLLTIISIVALVMHRRHMDPADSALKLGCSWLSAQVICGVAFVTADRFIKLFGADKAIADKDAIGTFVMVAFQEVLYIAAGIAIFIYLLKDIKKAEGGLKKLFHILLMIVLLAFVAIPLYVIVLEA